MKVVCQYVPCGKEFTKPLSRILRTAHNFCSLPCTNKALAKTGNRGKRKTATNQRWRERNIEQVRAIRRKYHYGITQEEFEARRQKQNNCCDICGRSFGDLRASLPHLDHDHKTKVNRGLLCGNCNRAIGLFQESAASLSKAIDYLTKWAAA